MITKNWKPLTSEQKEFLEKVLDIGLHEIVTGPKFLDYTRGKSDSERLEKGWCWGQPLSTHINYIQKVIDNESYNVNTGSIAGSTYLTSLGIYYKKWKFYNLTMDGQPERNYLP